MDGIAGMVMNWRPAIQAKLIKHWREMGCDGPADRLEEVLRKKHPDLDLETLAASELNVPEFPRPGPTRVVQPSEDYEPGEDCEAQWWNK